MTVAAIGDRAFLEGVAAMCVYAADSPDESDVETAIATLGNLQELLAEHRKREVNQ